MADSHLDQLIAELGRRAHDELEVVAREAQARIDEIRRAARQQEDTDRGNALAALEADYERRTTVAVADARRAARAAMLSAQHGLVDRVLQRTRDIVARRFAPYAAANGSVASPAGSRVDLASRLHARAEELASYASGGDADVAYAASGISLVADGGRLRIDDTVDAWLAGERRQLAIDVCRSLESVPC